MKIKVSKEAAQELEEAVAWYEMELPGLGARLISAFEHGAHLLSEPNPPLMQITGNAAGLGAKKLILHRFPFSLVTVQHDQTITIVALAHHSRLPDYWHGRLNP